MTNRNRNYFPKKCSFYSSSSSPSYQELPKLLLPQLRSLLPHLPILDHPQQISTYGRGESHHPTSPPWAVLQPKSTSDICEILKLASSFGTSQAIRFPVGRNNDNDTTIKVARVPIVPFGSGTSVEGHVCAIHGGLTLDMRDSFNSIELISNGDGDDPPSHARVGAGVTRHELNSYLQRHHTGMQFVVDPGATEATFGGMVATGASGTTSVKYGTMRENVSELECVLPPSNDGHGDGDGDCMVMKCGTLGDKSSAGYDVLGLMIGSEGTLGVVTSVTVKLWPVMEEMMVARCGFRSLEELCEVVRKLKWRGVEMVRCEVLDDISMEAFRRYNNDDKEEDVKPTLFLEFGGPSLKLVEEQVRIAKSICLEEGGSNFVSTSDEQQRKVLWSARHKLYYASLALRKGSSSAMLTDACVPLHALGDIMTKTKQDIKRLDVVATCFGHAGDGNFHCIMPLLDGGMDTPQYMDRLNEVNDNVVRRTLQVGGTCTGEHGIGYGKIESMKKQYGTGTIAMMETIKSSLDPLNMMNPGKVVSPQFP